MTDRRIQVSPLSHKLGFLALAGVLALPANAGAVQVSGLAGASTGGLGGTHVEGALVPEYGLLGAVLMLGLIAGAAWAVRRRARAARETLIRIDRRLVAVANTHDADPGELFKFSGAASLAPAPTSSLRPLVIEQPDVAPASGASQGRSLARAAPPAAVEEIGAGPPVVRQKALGYASVSADQDPQGPEFRAQAESIERACEQRGLDLVQVVRDIEPEAGSDLKRPGLIYSLERIAAGEASCLVVSGLDRLARSAADLGKLGKWFEQNDGRLIAIDLDLDTATPGGRTVTRTLAAVGGLDRRRLAESTRKGLAAARAKGTSSGRPAVSDRPALRTRIAAMRKKGMTLQAIADALNEEGVPTLRGGAQWRPSSVQAAAGYKRPGRKASLDGLPSTAGATPPAGMEQEGA